MGERIALDESFGNSIEGRTLRQIKELSKREGAIHLKRKRLSALMECKFTCKGHRNVLSTHATTLEFTKEAELTRNGDCILGVAADFEYFRIKEFLLANKGRRIKVALTVAHDSCSLQCLPNPEFSDAHEIVIRKGEYASPRTLGVFSTKAACDIPREMVRLMQDPLNSMTVTLHSP